MKRIIAAILLAVLGLAAVGAGAVGLDISTPVTLNSTGTENSISVAIDWQGGLNNANVAFTWDTSRHRWTAKRCALSLVIANNSQGYNVSGTAECAYDETNIYGDIGLSDTQNGAPQSSQPFSALAPGDEKTLYLVFYPGNKTVTAEQMSAMVNPLNIESAVTFTLSAQLIGE